MKEREINIEKFEEFFQKIKINNNQGKKKCIIFGGLGNPKHSVIALYGECLSKLHEYMEFIAVDVLVEKENYKTIKKREKEIYEITGIHYSEVYSPSQYYDLLKDVNYEVEAVFILTPVSTHFEILRNFSNVKNVSFIIEKPTCSIEEGRKDFFEFIDKLEYQGNSIYLIDTAMVSYSLDYFIKNNLKEEIGEIERVQVVALDNPWEIEDEIKEYSFQLKIEAINERGLLKSAKNGGAGLGFDMGIHGVAALIKLLENIDIDIEAFEIQNVLLECLDIEELERDKGNETYMLANLLLNDLDIIIEGGKGADIWDRRIEIYGTEKNIVIGFGTLLHKNYIAKFKGDKLDEVILFNTNDTGYENHMKDIIQLILDRNEEYILSPKQSILYMKKAIQLMNKIYTSIDVDINKREDKIIKKRRGPHINTAINEENIRIRKELMQIQKK